MGSQLLNNNYLVYKHTSPNGKVYIGITHGNPLNRWKGGWGYETQAYFWRAIVKYGWINFKHEILFTNLSKKEAETKESELIKEYNSTDINHGYNIDLGGASHLQCAAIREKVRKSKTGKKWSERRRVAAIEYFKHYQGRTVYKYDKDGNLLKVFNSVGSAARDAKVSPETLRSRLKNNKKSKTYDSYYSYGKFEDMGIPYAKGNYCKAPVDMYDLSLNFIRTFESSVDAGRFLGIKGAGHISDVCKGKRLSWKGYIWRYHNENKDNKSA